MGLKKHGNRTIGKKEFKISRLMVVFAIIIIPTLIVLLYIFGKNLFAWTPAIEDSVFLRWATPICFTIGWLFILIIFANRISNTIDKVDDSFRVIPNRYKVYYGVTAIIIFVGIIVPFITPLMCILAFASFGFQISTRNQDWDENGKTSKWAWIIMALFAAFPIFLAFVAYADVYRLTVLIWEFYQVNFLEILYRISMSLATALTIGSLITLIKLQASEYEQAEIKAEREDLNIRWVRIVEFFIFALFITIEIMEYYTPGGIKSLRILMQVIYWIGLATVVFITIVNIIRGRSSPDFRRYLLGYILTAILMGLNLAIFSFSWNDDVQNSIRNWSIIISALVYIIVFFLMFFFGASDDD